MINKQDIEIEKEEELEDQKAITGARVYHIKLQGFTRNKLTKMMQYYGYNASEMFRACINDFYGGKFRKETIGYHQGMTIFSDNLERKGKRAQREAIIDSIKKMSPPDLDIYLHELGYFPPDAPVDKNNPNLFMFHRATYPHDLEGKMDFTKPIVYEQQQWLIKEDKMTSCREIFGVDEIIKDLIKEKLI
jgi:hypothetical protein